MKRTGQSCLLLRRLIGIFAIVLFVILDMRLAYAEPVSEAATVSLDGDWQMGFSRNYTRVVQVPSIAADPTQMTSDVLWYKKEISLPPGNWKSATLDLKGARFQPQVYLNGDLVGSQPGGMAPVFFTLTGPSVKPGNVIALEIALAGLKNVPQTDASYIPGADHWRSNVSSGLWDDVVLHLHGDVAIDRVIPFIDYKNQTVSVKFDLNGAEHFYGKASVEVIDDIGQVLIRKSQMILGTHSSVDFPIERRLKSWSPDAPHLYHLRLLILDSTGHLSDQSTIPFGVRRFEVVGKHFELNGAPFVARGGTVVWHRWVRSKAGRELGYDTEWFKSNIIQRLKDHGANYLRFHLGKPPERFLDLCDQYGLAVQYEWSFFHGMPATKESLLEQYKSWLDVAMRHPCVFIVHPYNETGGEQLKTVWSALDELLVHYPPLVMEDRDVMHIHKYWWGLFENLGLYYDSADVFPQVIMVDEFGGNYLNAQGDLGGYPALKESYLRYLGRQHTKEERLAFHAQSNGKIAEYWRRIGAAGLAPFCILSSDEDGNNWFSGPLKDGNPMPVWDALTAAYSPQSVSIELWDKDFEPAQKLDLPIYLFNDDAKKSALKVKLTIESQDNHVISAQEFTTTVNAYSHIVQHVPITMPATAGEYVIKAELLNKPATVKYPVVSAWDFRVFQARVPENVKNLKVAVASDETELRQFLRDRHIATVDLSDNSSDIIVTSLKSWKALAQGNASLSERLQSEIARGKSVVMLDVGDRPLGQGYPTKLGDLGPLQGVATVRNPKTNAYPVFGGIALKFTETAEPESYFHPDQSNRELWQNLPEIYTWIWNGMRGGLTVPAASMEFSGLSAKAFLAQWKARGADETKIAKGHYYAYVLQGFYDFSDQPNDVDTQKRLKSKVQFLVQDAPALASSINPNTPVAVVDLAQGYLDAKLGMADNFVPLANCGKNLTQAPIALVQFGSGKGALLVSQLLTAGRLAKGFGDNGLYGIRYDEVTAQYVLNMMSLAVHN